MKFVKPQLGARSERPAKCPADISLPLGSVNLSASPLAGLDTETTGVDTATARVVSAALVLDTPGQEPVIQDWLLNPGIPIPLQATAVHGINTEHAEKYGIDAAEGIASILDMLSTVDIPLVMVNAAYDLSILYCEAARYGLDATPILEHLIIVDTLVMDRYLDMYRPGRRTLTAVSASYGIPIRGAHTASGDVLCSLRLVRAMACKFPVFAYADLDALQKVQADAFRLWGAEYQEYQRMSDPDFDVSTDWPYQVQLPL